MVVFEIGTSIAALHTAAPVPLEDLGLDVNGRDLPVGMKRGLHHGTPLCYMASDQASLGDCEEAAHFLLDRGASLDRPDNNGVSTLERIQASSQTKLKEAVAEWLARQRPAYT